MKQPVPIPLAKVRLNQPLILRQLGIILIILAAGLSIAFAVFLGELLTNRRKIYVAHHFDAHTG